MSHIPTGIYSPSILLTHTHTWPHSYICNHTHMHPTHTFIRTIYIYKQMQPPHTHALAPSRPDAYTQTQTSQHPQAHTHRQPCTLPHVGTPLTSPPHTGEHATCVLVPGPTQGLLFHHGPPISTLPLPSRPPENPLGQLHVRLYIFSTHTLSM